jgi:uncharacterized protein (DUF934 family)
MAHLIRRGRIENAHWPLLDGAGLRSRLLQHERTADGSAAAAASEGVLLPYPLWLGERAACAALGVPTGVLIGEDDDLAAVARHLDAASIAAVRFPRFTHGRGYSIARVLRGRHAYEGELRAVGDILRDQMFYLARVGFDAFELRADQDPVRALDALRDFSEAYQASTDRPVPLFRRRVA